jgi:BirA family biotin operon repressor/biotin-[acetyl-CoA-carboxylase] ligase
MDPQFSLDQIANQIIDRCDSTNDLARRLGEAGYPSGTWVATRIQERGRGRLGRKWESLEGNLFLSTLVRIEDKSLWTWIPMAAAIAVAQAIQLTYPRHDIAVQVKWPNDLWIHRRKLGGILCEAVGNRDTSFVIVGIGLNCTHAPTGLDQETVSLSDAAGFRVTAEDIRCAVVAELMNKVFELTTLGKNAIAEAYERLAALPAGAEITWGENTGTRKSGKIIGLGPLGELQVSDASGQRLNLYAEDVKIRPAAPY